MKKKISIVGGGACALMLACELNSNIFEISIYEKNAALGRKFLVAGDGGLNLTHSEDPANFILKYTHADFLKKAFKNFNNKNFIGWLNAVGIETFVGTSARVFPKRGVKPIEILNIFLKRIKLNNVAIHTKFEWNGFTTSNELLFEQEGSDKIIKSDVVIFCLGGASWPVTGSSGNWLAYFKNRAIKINPFLPSNCVFIVNWPKEIMSVIGGKAIKNCSIRCANKIHHGEIVITEMGVEGSGIYPLSPQIRSQLMMGGEADIFLDLKPALDPEVILKKLRKISAKPSYSIFVSEQLNLNRVQMSLLKNLISKEDFLNPESLTKHIKNLHFRITGTGPLEEAISTTGGIDLNEISGKFELKKMPGHFVIGEMLDYDAPTGGYLLQSCFTMAKYLADFLNNKQQK